MAPRKLARRRCTVISNSVPTAPRRAHESPEGDVFFDLHYDRGIEWFATHFEEYDGERAVGEATTRTIDAPGVPARVAEHLPDAKLLFVLRNPIDRAYSQYYFYIATGKAEPDSTFHEVIRDEQSVFRQDMIQGAHYAQHLARFEMYFERSQMKVIMHEDLRERTTETVRDVYRFLDIDSHHEPHTEERHNVTRYPESQGLYHWIRRFWHFIRQQVEPRFPKATDAARRAVRRFLFSTERPAMRDDDRAYLRRLYAEPNARLEERIGRDLSHWR